jgi:hypothetical protein
LPEGSKVANLHDGCATRELLRLAVDVEISSRNGFKLFATCRKWDAVHERQEDLRNIQPLGSIPREFGRSSVLE